MLNPLGFFPEGFFVFKRNYGCLPSFFDLLWYRISVGLEKWRDLVMMTLTVRGFA